MDLKKAKRFYDQLIENNKFKTIIADVGDFQEQYWITLISKIGSPLEQKKIIYDLETILSCLQAWNYFSKVFQNEFTQEDRESYADKYYPDKELPIGSIPGIIELFSMDMVRFIIQLISNTNTVSVLGAIYFTNQESFKDLVRKIVQICKNKLVKDDEDRMVTVLEIINKEGKSQALNLSKSVKKKLTKAQLNMLLIDFVKKMKDDKDN